MTEATENPQKFMIKLPHKLHRELMAFSGVKGKALSDILVDWITATWAQQPEHEALSKMVSPVAMMATPSSQNGSSATMATPAAKEAQADAKAPPSKKGKKKA